MSLARRLELIEWSRQHNAVLIEDDYDSEYRYSGPPLPSLQGLATGVAVIYIGTFSKVMFPSLRIGYVIAPPSLVARLRRAKWLADRQTPVPEQAALADFISEGHLERHIRRMRRIYGERRDALVESLRSSFRRSRPDSRRRRGNAPLGALQKTKDRPKRPPRRKSNWSARRACYLTEPPRRRIHSGILFDRRAIHSRRDPAAGGSSLTNPGCSAESTLSRAIR